MASRQSGGVGAFSWTLLGFLAGVAATLAVQMLLIGREHGDDSDDDTHTATAVVVTPKLPAPTTAHHHKSHAVEAEAQVEPVTTAPEPAAAAPVKAAPVAPKPKPKAESVDDQMADDAAAAGMTSRAHPEVGPER